MNVVTRMGSAEVLEAFYPLLFSRGKPEYLRSNDGPEFTSAPFEERLLRVGIQPIQIYPGSTRDNGYNKRIKGTLRWEMLNAEWFLTAKQAQTVINQWLRQYSHIQSHHPLCIRPPVPWAAILCLLRAGQPGGDTRLNGRHSRRLGICLQGIRQTVRQAPGELVLSH